MRWGGGRKGITGLDSAGACGEAPHVSYQHGTCGGSPWPLCTVGERSPPARCEAAVLPSSESQTRTVKGRSGNVRSCAWAAGAQEGHDLSVRNAKRFLCTRWGRVGVSLSPALQESRGSQAPLAAPTHVGRPARERRAGRNVRHYAHCPLAAGSHLLFRSAGGISQR